MTTKRVIAEKPWSYVLFEDEEALILTLLVGGVVEVDVSVRLTTEEAKAIKSNELRVEDLVAAVKQHRQDFAGREINPPVWP